VTCRVACLPTCAHKTRRDERETIETNLAITTRFIQFVDPGAHLKPPVPDRGPSRSAAAYLVERLRNAPDHLDRAMCCGRGPPALRWKCQAASVVVQAAKACLPPSGTRRNGYLFSATNGARGAAFRPLHLRHFPGAGENPQRHCSFATPKRRKRRAPFARATETVITYHPRGMPDISRWSEGSGDHR